jgi:D-amino-acid dehydrogenase
MESKNSKHSVAIVGGGIIGLAAAYYLSRAGHAVTIIEKGDITDGCSFGNMGYVSPSHFTPLASPGVIKEGLKYTLSSSSPFYIRPRLDLALMRWAWQFRRHANAETVQRNTPHLNGILQRSRKLMSDLRIDLGDRFGLQEKGIVNLAERQSTLDHELKLAEAAEKFGLQAHPLSRAEVQQLEPGVEMDVLGGVLWKDDCHCHPGKLMEALSECVKGNRAAFVTGATVTGFETSGKTITAVVCDNRKVIADEIVLAAGSWLPLVSRKLGVHLLLQPGKGYSYTYESVEQNIRYPAILVDHRCAATPWQNSLRIGGTMELSGINHSILPKRMAGIYSAIKKCYPGLRIDYPRAERIWCGLRPVTPDGLPYLGRHPKFGNLIIAGGHAMLGISLALGSGEVVLHLVNGEPLPLNIEAFAPERFSGNGRR